MRFGKPLAVGNVREIKPLFSAAGLSAAFTGLWRISVRVGGRVVFPSLKRRDNCKDFDCQNPNKNERIARRPRERRKREVYVPLANPD